MKKRYPWNLWLDQRTFTLRQGKHFSCMPHAMAQQVRNEASRRGKMVSVKIDETGAAACVRVTVKE